MAKWSVNKNERKSHDSGAETTTYAADIFLEGDDPASQITLAELATLIENLTTEDGIPTTAKLSATITAPLRWTDEDLA